jgi:phosphatidylserine decarboxylase
MTSPMNLLESMSFLLTNRIPRRSATLFMGWFSPIEQPLVRSLSLKLWEKFSDLDLSEAKKSEFRSVQDCFTRELKEGARPIAPDPETMVSPCDGIVGAFGTISDGTVVQAKGFPYTLADLLGDASLAAKHEGGQYVTLRITPTMYHRFHAPHDLEVDHVTYISGDTWNVYPPALKRVERLFCRNERAVLRCRLSDSGTPLLLVPVAAVLVASIRLHCADVLLHLRYKGANEIECHARYSKGQEMGWFQHGSTIIVIAPKGLKPCELREGQRIRMGEPLLQLNT